MRNLRLQSWASSWPGILVIVLFVLVIFASNFAVWIERLSMCALFCALLYLRDQSSQDRWLAIAIMIGGTLLSFVWSF